MLECENGPNHAMECKYYKDSKPYPEGKKLNHYEKEENKCPDLPLFKELFLF